MKKKMDIYDSKGFAPIHYACMNGDEKKLLQLIKEGADINCLTKEYEMYPLELAIINNQERIALLLIEKQCLIFNKNGYTPLCVSAVAGLLRLVRKFISMGGDVNMQIDGDGNAPLHYAVESEKVSIIKELLAAGANIDVADINNFTPLMQATGIGCYRIVKYLLDNGADVNMPEYDGDTPLHTACAWNHKRIAKLLINKGAKVNAVNKEGKSPLFYAVVHQHYDIVRFMGRVGADFLIEDNKGRNIYRYAIKIGDKKIINIITAMQRKQRK